LKSKASCLDSKTHRSRSFEKLWAPPGKEKKKKKKKKESLAFLSRSSRPPHHANEIKLKLMKYSLRQGAW